MNSACRRYQAFAASSFACTSTAAMPMLRVGGFVGRGVPQLFLYNDAPNGGARPALRPFTPH